MADAPKSSHCAWQGSCLPSPPCLQVNGRAEETSRFLRIIYYYFIITDLEFRDTFTCLLGYFPGVAQVFIYPNLIVICVPSLAEIVHLSQTWYTYDYKIEVYVYQVWLKSRTSTAYSQ
jgi:hypothetical protein